jgi:hypothetical protein
MDRPTRSSLLSRIGNFSAIGAIACVLADATHELGHAITARLLGVRILSLSSVALQTEEASRLVAAAGTSANVLVGAVTLLIFGRKAKQANSAYFVWLFAAFNLLNSGYLVASAVLMNGDWGNVIGGLPWLFAWRSLLGIVGAFIYAASMHWLVREMAWLIAHKVARATDVRTLVWTAYLASGVVLTFASALNPISARLILISGIGASFGLSAGLLFVPSNLALPASADSQPTRARAPLSIAWIGAAIILSAIFIAVLGPGIHFGG